MKSVNGRKASRRVRRAAGALRAPTVELGARASTPLFSTTQLAHFSCHSYTIATASDKLHVARPFSPPRSGLRSFWSAAMAPITDDIVDTLRDTIHKLESRVQQLEAKLQGGGSSSPSPSSGTNSVRMILMGPPGAGMRMVLLSAHVLAHNYPRQGHTGAQDKREILRLPSCTFQKPPTSLAHRTVSNASTG